MIEVLTRKSLTMIAQNLSQRQQLKILPQQIQLLNIFHLTTLELDQQIQFELEDNPVLEESNKDNDSDGETEDSSSDVAEWDDLMYDDIPDYKLEYGNYLSPESIPERPIAEDRVRTLFFLTESAGMPPAAVRIIRPTPGYENSISVRMAPLNTVPSDSASAVTCGNIALRKT